MTVLAIALTMTVAMIGAALYSLHREQRGAMYRSLRSAQNRGRFAEPNRFRS